MKPLADLGRDPGLSCGSLPHSKPAKFSLSSSLFAGKGSAGMTLGSLLHSAFVSLRFLRQDFCCPLSPVKVGFDKNTLEVVFLAPYQRRIRDLEKLG